MGNTNLKLREKYTVQFKNFEGPFDLLFYLIEKNKLDIYDIPIGEITDRYMEHILTMQELDLEIASEFIVMASTLLYIKSRSLLPNKKDEKQQDMEIGSKDELILKLIEYKKYKNVATVLKEKQNYWSRAYYRKPEKFKQERREQYLNLSLEKMVYIYRDMLLKNLNKLNNNTKKMIRILRLEKITVKQKIKDIIKKLIELPSFKFSDVFNRRPKIEIVTSFMAMLELIKVNKIFVVQERPFSDIIINKNSSDEDLVEYAKED